MLITGGAGFVGSSLALGFKAAGIADEIIALDNLKRRGSELNLARLKHGGVQFLHGDIRQTADIESTGQIDALIECSADPSVQAGYGSDPRYVVDTNLAGTVNCLEWARRCEATTVFLSTSRVYPIKHLRGLRYREGATRLELEDEQPMRGATAGGIAEDFPLDGARSLYGATKLCSELLLQEYSEMYGLPCVINRCGILAGPWQMGKVDQGVVSLWAARHVLGGKLSYIGFGGTGKQVRDMLHVDDLLQLLLLQLREPARFSGVPWNVGGGRERSASLLELTSLCEQLTGNKLDIGSKEETHPADVPIYITDAQRVCEATGWNARKSVTQILEEVVQWVRAEQDLLRHTL